MFTFILTILGVGKTAFINLLCYNKVLTNPYWTIGAQLEIKVRCLC